MSESGVVRKLVEADQSDAQGRVGMVRGDFLKAVALLKTALLEVEGAAKEDKDSYPADLLLYLSHVAESCAGMVSAVDRGAFSDKTYKWLASAEQKCSAAVLDLRNAHANLL